MGLAPTVMGKRKQRSVHKPVEVSNHALFRWLERTGVVDVEALRAALSLALDRAVAASAAMGAEEFLILSNGLAYVVKNGVVVTVLEQDGRYKHVRPTLDRDNQSDDRANPDFYGSDA